jgi:hypothetical protein
MPEVKIQYERQDDVFYVCRGPNGCGSPLYPEDRQRHSRHHAMVLGAAEQIDVQGHNVPFLDPQQDPDPGNFYDQEEDAPIDQTQVMRPRGRYNGQDWDRR